jgi:hypothetical protein
MKPRFQSGSVWLLCSGAQSHQQGSATNQSQSLLFLDRSMDDRTKDVRIKPGITRLVDAGAKETRTAISAKQIDSSG